MNSLFFVCSVISSLSNDNDDDGEHRKKKMNLRRLQLLLVSLSNNVFEQRTSTGSSLFSFLDDDFAQIFSQIASIRVKKLSYTNFKSSRHV